jgi:signal transduction histidine kinase
VADVGRVAIVRDISRQVEVERAKDAVLGIVSHEMRTPLAAIMGFAELIALRSAEGKEMANRVHANAQRLIHMVDDLLDHAQAQAGVLKIHMDAVSLRSLQDAVMKGMSILANEKNLQLKMEIDAELPPALVGDGARLQQILVNLVGNAIKFTEGGEVCVAFQKRDAQWAIVVRDTGIGIPEERLPDIFEPFRRASDYTTRRHQGAGLGLSIVKTLVSLMEGTIQVKSIVGQGSTFTVLLPLNKEDC